MIVELCENDNHKCQKGEAIYSRFFLIIGQKLYKGLLNSVIMTIINGRRAKRFILDFF